MFIGSFVGDGHLLHGGERGMGVGERERRMSREAKNRDKN